ncbi:MAG: ribbon-helix-helix domain-containing protein [Candidatus Odinarchaeota archaeon]
MAKSNFKDPKDIREKLVHIAFSENEVNEIDNFAEEGNYSTRTEFIRQAVFDKINRIKNPDLFMTKTQNNGKISEFLEEVRVNNEQQKEILKKLSILNDIQQTLGVLQSLTKQPEIEKNKKIIIELLKKHKHLKPLKIMELSKLASHEVYDVISDEALFIININGEVELK